MKIDILVNNILNRVDKTIRGTNLRAVAQEAASRIKKRTRLGYGVEGGERGGKREKLKGLSDKYKAQRKKYGSFNKQYTKAGKSNLTRTGALLDAIKGKVSGKKIELTFKENRKDGVTNADIVKWQSEKGRDFFEITDKELKGLRNMVKKDLIKRLRKK